MRIVTKNLIDFLTIDIWRIRSEELPYRKSFLLRQLRLILLALKGFDEDRCMLRASSLTFYSLLSIVPVAALGFGIAKGFGFEKLLEKQLLERFSGQEEVFMRVIEFSSTLLEKTRGSMVAGVGVALLFWAVLKVLGHIESALNDIWEQKKPRSLWRKFSDYFAITLISPIFIIMSSSATVFVTTQIKLITQKVVLIGYFSPVIFFLLKFTPYLLVWALFTFIYIVMPNTKVRFVSGLIAGIVAGTMYQVLQGTYIHFQVLVAKYNAIYGSFAALPLFLTWLQLSWLIVLFGAEVSFAHQNVDTYEFEPDRQNLSPAFKKLLALQISHLMVKTFSNGREPLTTTDIVKALEIPHRVVRQILFELDQSGLVSEVESGDGKEVAYQPARDTDLFSIQYILEALDHKGTDDIHVAPSEELEKFSTALNRFNELIKHSPANQRLKDI